MLGIREYIDQEFKKAQPRYSEVLYIPSVANPATQFVQIDHRAQGAVLILVHSLFLQTPTIAIPAVQITDRFGRVLFQFVPDVNVSGFYETPYILRGSELFFSVNNLNINFTIGYQYLMQPERP